MTNEVKPYEPPKYHHCGTDECTSHEWMTNLVDDLDSLSSDLWLILENRRKESFVSEIYAFQEKLYEILKRHNHVQDGTWRES